MPRFETQFTEEVAKAVDQVCTPLYEQMFEKVAKEQPDSLANEESTMLAHYPNKITWYQGDQRQEIVERIRRTHLKWFGNWLNENCSGHPPYIKWNSTTMYILLHVSNLLFRMDLGDVITSNESRDEFRQVIDTIKHILSSINESNPVTIDSDAIPLVQQLLQILFYFTLDNEFVIYLKGLQLVKILNILLQTSNNHNEIHFHAYRILAVIMAEVDIKQLQNSSRIANVFITFINNVIDEGVRSEGRLHNSLRSLKG